MSTQRIRSKTDEDNKQLEEPESESLSKATSLERQQFVFERELVTCRDLLELEPECKWVLLTIAVLLGGLTSLAKLKGDSIAIVQTHTNEVESTFNRLKDPLRANYYKEIKVRLVDRMATATS